MRRIDTNKARPTKATFRRLSEDPSMSSMSGTVTLPMSAIVVPAHPGSSIRQNESAMPIATA